MCWRVRDTAGSHVTSLLRACSPPNRRVLWTWRALQAGHPEINSSQFPCRRGECRNRFETSPTTKKCRQEELHCGNLHQPLGWVRCQKFWPTGPLDSKKWILKINLCFGGNHKRNFGWLRFKFQNIPLNYTLVLLSLWLRRRWVETSFSLWTEDPQGGREVRHLAGLELASKPSEPPAPFSVERGWVFLEDSSFHVARRARQRNREQFSAAPSPACLNPPYRAKDGSMFHEWATSILGAVEQLTLKRWYSLACWKSALRTWPEMLRWKAAWSVFENTETGRADAHLGELETTILRLPWWSSG